MRPRKKRDAILWHVASWGDRIIPIALLQRNWLGLSTRSPRRCDLLFRKNGLRKSPARDDNRQSGNQKQDEDDLAEGDLIQFAIERPAKQRSGNQHRQANQKQPGGF